MTCQTEAFKMQHVWLTMLFVHWSVILRMKVTFRADAVYLKVTKFSNALNLVILYSISEFLLLNS